MSGVLSVRDLSVVFRTRRGPVRALAGAELELGAGELLVVIGESGSGKSVLAHALLGLLPRNAEVSGSVRVEGQETLTLPDRSLRALRRERFAFIPQSPGASLNPVRRVGPVLVELASARGLDRRTAEQRIATALAELGLSWPQVRRRYPHELSGGMQQRVLTALALASAASIVVADEPTSGLDADLVDVTARQLTRVRDQGAALLVITHDLRLAQRLGGRVALLYASYLVEQRTTPAFFAGPAHPYGAGLLAALPERGGVAITGLPPELAGGFAHCPFLPRCPVSVPACDGPVPEAFGHDGGAVRCYRFAEPAHDAAS